MERLNVARDIQPLSAFRKQASALIDELQRSRRPLVLTRNGRSAVVILDVGEFERMVERIELLEDVQTAREQARRGETVPQQEALEYVSDRIGSDRTGSVRSARPRATPTAHEDRVREAGPGPHPGDRRVPLPGRPRPNASVDGRGDRLMEWGFGVGLPPSLTGRPHALPSLRAPSPSTRRPSAAVRAPG